MNLSHFNVTINMTDLKDCSMCIEIDYRYLEARLSIDVDEVTEMWKEDRELILACLAHELSHVITKELTDPFDWKGRPTKKQTETNIYFEERVTETVSRLALRLYKLENKL